MTSRRRIPSGSERQSRLDQFRPGHVGGRVASAQPIRRNGGTLRRVSVGAVEIPPPDALPVVSFSVANYSSTGAYSTPGFVEVDAGVTLTAASGVETAIAWALCFGSEIISPSGWTSLASGGPVGPGTGADVGFHWLIATRDDVTSSTPAVFDLPDFSPGWSWPPDAGSGADKWGMTLVSTLLVSNVADGLTLVAGTPSTPSPATSFTLPDPDVAWAHGLTSLIAAPEPGYTVAIYMDVGSPEWTSEQGWGWYGWGGDPYARAGCSSPGLALPETVAAYTKAGSPWPYGGSYAGIPLPMPPSEGTYVNCDAVAIALGWV